MKHLKLLLAVALIAVTGLSGCVKSTIKAAGTTDSKYIMHANVNGSDFIVDLCTAVVVDGKLTIAGSNSASADGSEHIFLTIYNWNGTTMTTPITTPTGTNTYGEYSTGIGSSLTSYSGLVNITKVTNDDVTGSFYFNCAGVTIRYGTFFAKRK